MPVKIWESTDDGLTSHVVTEWERAWTSEEFRSEADDLDEQLDIVLDKAVDRVADSTATNAPVEFLRAWAVGACLNESKVLDSPAMQREQPKLLRRTSRSPRASPRSGGD